jgi:hypothetical protein
MIMVRTGGTGQGDEGESIMTEPLSADAPPPGTYALDPEHTTIRADVKAMFGLMTVHGTFRLRGGQLRLGQRDQGRRRHRGQPAGRQDLPGDHLHRPGRPPRRRRLGGARVGDRARDRRARRDPAQRRPPRRRGSRASPVPGRRPAGPHQLRGDQEEGHGRADGGPGHRGGGSASLNRASLNRASLNRASLNRASLNRASLSPRRTRPGVPSLRWS